mmetsp:Transcript_32327/g.59780  ORF Transcript_32327/g.59780 Transcript_32327/m.59780 type:complete len:264 (+) Transcript_32327:189-980(+)
MNIKQHTITMKSRRTTPTSNPTSTKSVNTEATGRVKNSAESNAKRKKKLVPTSESDELVHTPANIGSNAKNTSLSKQVSPATAASEELKLESHEKNNMNSAATEKKNKCGKKIYLYKDLGGVYEGQFKDGKRHGIGTLKWADGDEYEGEWKAGKPHGRGTMKYANGDVYKGQFEKDKRHGRGTYKWAEGDVYIGKWKDDKRHGLGTRRYAKGDLYYGEWNDGKRHGDGAMKYANGGVYTGGWKDNERHGKGEWKDGKKRGKGT